MPDILSSYLGYARGESSRSVWAVLDIMGALIHPFINARNAFYDRGIFCSIDPPLPVVSVGNLCSGGTNKTPMVDMLARRFIEYGASVGIVSRGYSGRVKSPLLVGQGGISSDRSITGDEPLMLATRLPEARVVVSRDRLEGVRYLRGLGAGVVIADDAFQHRRMGRDLDIVLIDATCPFGNGKLFPAGILREHINALMRADIVVLTKAEQAGAAVEDIRRRISEWIPSEAVFTARVVVESWIEISGDGFFEYASKCGGKAPQEKFISFSAIGNPQSFYRSLASIGLDVVKSRSYRDHHRFTWSDIDSLERLASDLGATAFICTEKDLQNMPPNPFLLYPLYIPRIRVSIDDDEKFWKTVTQNMRPRFVVASNGYGEDAIGSLLASRLRERFPEAGVFAFSLVGAGAEYKDKGIEVVSPVSEMPSAGIVKYSFKALLGDFKHGLLKVIRRQIAAWRKQRRRFRAPICVGDVYLLLHTLWGQGMSPLLVATAKSVKLRGHWMVERALMRRRTRRVWTRDSETERDLGRSGIDAVFRGNPIMDLAVASDAGEDPWDGMERPHVMLLPGSRPRAYRDTSMLLDAVKLMSAKMRCRFLMVLAPTLDMYKMISESGYRLNGANRMTVGSAEVGLYTGPIASVAYGADLLIGLGGTANQVSAGMGVPVLSVIERGKLVQKKLLQDSEVLASPNAEALAEAALEILRDPKKRFAMSRAGIRLMGGAGAIDDVVRYAASELGWDARCGLFVMLSKIWGGENAVRSADGGRHPVKEGELEWKMPKRLASKVTRLVKIIK
ncbi:MAG: tetraacyldisaccharide 4'-kinase [Synergistaceae bacterium]|nr:tetraacyldisaccharide 4'-kinase [Synergistaceae bacterium]